VPTRKGNHKVVAEFDALLDQAAEAVVRGDDPEIAMARYGDTGARLKPFLALVARLQVLREPPPPPSLAAGRARFLAQAQKLREGRSSRRSHASPGIVAWPWGNVGTALLRPVVSVLIAAIMLSLVAFTAQAASQSLPGSPFYPVKLAVERTQVAVTFDAEAEARLETMLAHRRLSEVRLLAQAGHEPDTSTLDRLEKQWSISLRAIAAVEDQETAILLAQALEILAREHESLYCLLDQSSPEMREYLQAALLLTQEMELAFREAMANPSEFRHNFARPTEPAAPPTQSHSLKPGTSATPTAQKPTPTPSSTAQVVPPSLPTATAQPPDTGVTPPNAPKVRRKGLPPSPTPTETSRTSRSRPKATPTPTSTHAKPTKPITPSPTQSPLPAWTPTPSATPTLVPTNPPTREPTATATGLPLDPTPAWTSQPTQPAPEPSGTPKPTPTPTQRLTPWPARPTPPAFTPRPTKPPPPTYPPLPREPTVHPGKPVTPDPDRLQPEPQILLAP